MNKNKHLLLSIIGIAILVIAVVGVTYAFFTYSKTGNENTIRTGDIYFNSTETGNTVTLSNVFPVASSTIGTVNESANDVGTVAITIEGNTTYNGGVEYVLTLDDVNVETNTNPAKEIPLSLNVSVESITDQTTSTTTSIGTSNDNYFTARGTTASPSSTAIYKITAGETVEEDEQILVGYVPKNVTVKGKVVVKAYIDDAKVLITDTPDAVDTTGKTVISTTEWNSIKGNSALSFKVKVEARDGIWVPKPIGPATFDTGSVVNTKIRSIENFRDKALVRAISSPDTTGFNSNNIISAAMSETPIYMWYDENNIYWYSDANIVYLNSDSSSMFSWLLEMDLSNAGLDLMNASQIVNASNMFRFCNVDFSKLTNWDVSNITNMSNMFMEVFANNVPAYTKDAHYINNWNVSNVNNFDHMFAVTTNNHGDHSNYVYPTFSIRPGTWDNSIYENNDYEEEYAGTYVPNE